MSDNILHVQAKLPKEVGEWVKDNFPHGFNQEFIESCYVNLKRIMETGKLPPPSEYARQATIQALGEMAGES